MRRYLVKIAMQYGLMAQQILSIDFDLLEKTINEYYAKAHAFYLKSVKDCQLDSKEDKEKQKMADLRNLAVSIYEKVDKLVYGDMVKAIVDSMEDAATRFAKIEKTIEELLADNPKLTTLDINRILYRQFGTRIYKGTVSWSGEAIQLHTEVTEQLRQNYLVSRGIHPSSYTAINKNSLQPQRDNREDGGNIQRPMPDVGGGTDTNREWELNGNMDMSVDEEEAQRRKWRR